MKIYFGASKNYSLLTEKWEQVLEKVRKIPRKSFRDRLMDDELKELNDLEHKKKILRNSESKRLGLRKQGFD
jgi:DNA-binding PadR family transcriptional regulator